jgi:exodeoxyribonuclease V alpha subunit
VIINALNQSKSVTAKVVVTSFHPGPQGGGILIGTDERGVSRRAAVPSAVLPRRPVNGELWRVVGTEAFSFEHSSPYTNASIALPMPLEGEAVVRYLADNPTFPGVGYKTAQKLRNALGLDGLYDALENKRHAVLAAAIGPQLAAVVVNAIDLLNDEINTLRELEREGVDGATAGLAFSVWGVEAPKYLAAQPYGLRLLLPWSSVDERALRMGILPDDERRLFALVEEAFARLLKRGHTGATQAQVCSTFQQLAKTVTPIQTVTTIQHAIDSGRCLKHPSGLLQSRGVSWMEREVERVLIERVEATQRSAAPDIANTAIRDTEVDLKKTMTARQREAVQMVLENRVCALAGGAGTGKTTALHAISRARLAVNAASEDDTAADDRIVQAAVAGRAARRIAQATGLPAVTIARLIRDLESDRRNLAGSLLVIDESSMLDLPMAYQLLTRLPADCDLLFVGDPAQLPPIGPGQIFSSVLAGNRIPSVELDLPQRQRSGSVIPAVALAIREGRLPDLPTFDPSSPDSEGVSILPTPRPHDVIAKATLEAFASMAGPVPQRGRAQSLIDRDVQVLCATKNGMAGAKALNREIEDRYMSRQLRAAGWGLSVGSKVLWLRNDYDKAPLRTADGAIKVDARNGRPEALGLMNGCLGVVRRHSDGRDTDTGAPGSWIEFEDGARDWIYEADLQNLTHGWSVTVHKAQGSAFERVVVPIASSHLVDRALIYTAVTRAVRTCVLVGDPAFIGAAIKAPSRAQLRQTCLSL